jgi:hypothetical protein
VKLKEPSYGVLIRLMEAMLKKAKSKGEADSTQKAFKARLESSSIIYDGIVDLLQNSPLAKVDFIECSWQSIIITINLIRRDIYKSHGTLVKHTKKEIKERYNI